MSQEISALSRRAFMGGTLGVAAALSQTALAQPAAPPAPGTAPPADLPPLLRTDNPLYRLEADVRDCEVEGTVPSDLRGAFYRVGPDPQYPLAPGNIPFDGEGHASMFRLKDGRVDYRSRYIRNERWLAQDEARRSLFPMYRNPSLDHPSVKGLSRSTANTHIINHRNLLLALKEDSPPTALDLLTLETRVANYTFDGRLPSLTFTAHPKVDSVTGNIVAFGYEAEGHGSDVVSVFEITPSGEIVWNAKVRAPYVGSLHDFAVTENYIAFFLQPVTFDEAQMARGGIHWSWDATKPSYFGYLRRGGDGSDLRWIEGPARGMYHVMGAFDDGRRVYVDMPLAAGNQLPFIPYRDGSRWNPAVAMSNVTRVSADLTARRPKIYAAEVLYPLVGDLPRQDDRYNTMPYRYGFQPVADPAAAPGAGGACYARFDHQTRKAQLFKAGTATSLAECCFAPKHADAREGEGYLLGVATRHDRGGATELLILDAERIEEGPIATVKLPMPAVGQVHGFWVPEAKLSAPAA